MKIATKYVLLTALFITSSSARAQDGSEASSVHSYSMKTINGDDKKLADYAGYTLLIVNTASRCGYTPQYESLETLYREYKDKGLRILAFPANNFGGQEPGTNEQILEFCKTKFDVSFDLFSKISVKGEDIDPLYAYLTGKSGFNGDIRWNFTKFIVDGNGKVVARFETKVDPLSDSVKQAIEKSLSAGGI